VAHEAQHTVDYLAGKPSGTSVEDIQRMRAEQGLPPLSPEQAELAFLSDPGEARGRLAQVRAGASPEQRAEIFPFEQRFGGLDMPPSAVQAMPGPTDLSSGMGRSQRGAVMFGMGGEQARPLRDVLAEQPTTLRVLENLPGKRTTLTVGSDNVFDVYPDAITDLGNVATGYSGQGTFGVYRYSGLSPFGFNGRYMYARVSYGL
jgi:hypothetical protein